VASVELCVDARATLGESPLWDDLAGRLWWTDILGRRLHYLDHATAATGSVATTQELGAIVLRSSGGLVAAARDGFAVVEESGGLTMLADVERDDPANRMNDGAVDPWGRFWASTMSFKETVGAGSLYRLDEMHQVTRQLGGLTIGNGIDWSPDRRRMYFVDSATRRVDVIDVDPESGELGARREFVSVTDGGTPDGLCVDAEGSVWVAIWGGWAVRAYDTEARQVASIELPVAHVTSCAFGGPDLDELYVTSARAGLTAAELKRQPLAGGLFVATPGARGRPATRYRG